MYLGFRSLIVDLNPADCSPTTTHIFGNEVESIDIGDEAACWISEFLGKECRISFKPRNRHLRDKSIDRPSGRDWRLENNPINDKNEAGFQDGYPYLMLGEDSLADINTNITHKTYTMRTFRTGIAEIYVNYRTYSLRIPDKDQILLSNLTMECLGLR